MHGGDHLAPLLHETLQRLQAAIGLVCRGLFKSDDVGTNCEHEDDRRVNTWEYERRFQAAHHHAQDDAS